MTDYDHLLDPTDLAVLTSLHVPGEDRDHDYETWRVVGASWSREADLLRGPVRVRVSLVDVSALSDLERQVYALFHGIGTRAHSREEITALVGLDREGVDVALRGGVHHSRSRRGPSVLVPILG